MNLQLCLVERRQSERTALFSGGLKVNLQLCLAEVSK